jgi:hypothetical protein
MNSVEERMRYLLLLLPLLAVGCADTYDRGYAGDYYGRSPTYASGYGYNDSYYGRPYRGAENCGTPDDPRACPPAPRRPLPYYPANRW